jgi:hypothetical protein
VSAVLVFRSAEPWYLAEFAARIAPGTPMSKLLELPDPWPPEE